MGARRPLSLPPAIMLLSIVAAPAAADEPPAATAERLTVEQCVEVAIGGNADIEVARAKVRGWRARLAEVESIHYPKLEAMTFLAPMFTVRGSALDRDVERDFSPDAWGPYTHLEAQLAWPIYAFGRIQDGKDAARHRTHVEEAQVRIVQHTVALEVRKLYYTHLYARSMLPALDLGIEVLETALEKGREMYEEATGDVTQADLAKLEYGKAELTRLRRVASDGAALALKALEHTMGRPAVGALVLVDERLPPSVEAPPPLAEALQIAAERRPEWDQLHHGEQAALSLESAEILANAPVVFAAGQLEWDWAPTRDGSDNPYHYDEYNELFGGVAVGLLWNFDPAMASAKAEGARALQDEVAALRRFAQTGIPLQVRQAHEAVLRNVDAVKLTKQGEKAAKKWMTFAGAAYRTGTGEARDVLEGLVAFLSARRTRYETLRDYHIAQAELLYTTGRAVAGDGDAGDAGTSTEAK